MSTEVSHNKTNYQFKLMYALGMVLVVANHCEYGGISLFYEIFPAYSFHMGLFMFSSGYFYKESAELHIRKYINKKLNTLILPLYLWNFVYALFAQIMSLRGFSLGIGVSFRQLFMEPITNGHQYIYNLATWFVVPLFMVEVLNVSFRRILSRIDGPKKEYIYITLSLVLGMFSIFLSNKGLNTGWWLVLTRMLHLFPFYCVGYFYNKVLEQKDTLPNFTYFLIVVGIELMIIIYKGTVLVWEQVWCNFTIFDAWPYIVGFLGIAFWLRITRILEPTIGKGRVVNLIADNTFSIMVNQFLGFMLVKSVFAIGYKYSNTLFQDFDWTAYHTSIWYYYLPKGIEQTRIIYVFVAIAVPILIQKIIDKCKNKLDDSIGIDEGKKRIIYFVIYVSIFCLTGLTAFLIAKKVEYNGGIMIPQINK